MTKALNADVEEGLVAQFKAARRCGTPLVAVHTSDQFATTTKLVGAFDEAVAFVTWDCIRGFVGANKAGQQALKGVVNKGDDAAGSFANAATLAQSLGERTVLVAYNAQRHLDDPMQVQSVANLRDTFKLNRRTLVLMGPSFVLPSELQSDVITLDEPLPTAAELKNIVNSVYKSAKVNGEEESVTRAVEAVQGLSAFAAEQVTAMSMTPKGLAIDALWERKRQQIEQTPGLSVSREGIKFSDLGGVTVIKDYLRDLLNGNARPNAVVFLDEIEKMLGGADGDTSGVTQDQLGAILTYMQNQRAMGVLLVGHPGSGKSAVAKATGNEAGVPTISLDLGAAKGSLVGQSEQQLRTALKVITSVSNGSSLWIATCNSMASLKPELRRRFKCGVFFFDLPTAEERTAIWKVHRQRFNVSAKDKQPDDRGWTGAEIEQCCELAWRLNKPLIHAANFVVPISQAAPERVEQLRSQADGKWLSASHTGTYTREQDAQPMAGRLISDDE